MNEIQWDKINFIAYAITPWQIVGIEAAIEMLKHKGVTVDGVVLLAEHEITGRCITKENFKVFNDGTSLEFINIKHWRFDSSNNIIDHLRTVISVINNTKSEVIYVVNAGKIDLRWIRQIKLETNKSTKYILVDDGTGSYTGYRGLNMGISRHIKSYIYKQCFSRLAQNKMVIDFRLLKCIDGKYIPNGYVPDYYKIILEEGSNIDNTLLQEYSCDVLINSQCLFDNHEIEGMQDINTFKAFNDLLPENIVVTLKKHPREKSIYRYEGFNWNIMENCDYTQEEIFSKLKVKPKLLVGITSSTLINSSILFGINSISLAKLFIKQGLPKGIQADVKDFISNFENILLFPNNEDELQQMIENTFRGRSQEK